jgi:two-component system KDP operon response regulator KdpE
MSRILVVDDETAITRLLSAILGRGDFDTVTAADARSALALLDRGGINAMIVDLGLPDMDGMELIAAIRARSSVPILVVTARHETSEKIAALDLGADDYVTKPFDGDELLARLRAALRRGGTRRQGDGRMDFGPISIDVARHQVTRNGVPVTLTPREFAVLRALVEADGRVLTHAALLERVWGRAHVGDVDYLRVVVRALRLKLEEEPAAPTLIRNEPGVGYRLSEPQAVRG